tara:strand:- start:27 stop:1871 length:1845 start_codon:yes stop_codon:yes gene_type:complete
MSEISNLERENKAFKLLKRRSNFLFFMIFLVGLVSLFQFIKLTIIDANIYTTKAEENRIIRVPLYPSRGLIKFSDNELLVENVVSQALTIIPAKTLELERTLEELKLILDIKEEAIKDIKQRLDSNNLTYESLVIVENLTQEQLSRYIVERSRWPSTSVEAQLMRFNIYGHLFSHVIGYMGPVSIEEIQDSNDFKYPLGYQIGKTGVEKFYEKEMRGSIGFKTIEVDVHGKELRELDRVFPDRAKDIYTSLDKDLQLLARKELDGRKGAIVALDPNNGLIKALVSSPDFNPNILNKTELGNIQELLDEETGPLFNRAISGNYPPASTIKPFIGLLGLREKVIDWNSTIEDEGFFQIDPEGRKYRGWKEDGHGIVDLNKSIIESSDVFFYQLATQLTIDNISNFLSLFGFGSKTGIDLYAETEGTLPNRKWKIGKIGETWFIGDTINIAIGQGYLSCSPLQLVVALSVLATKGKAYKPRVIEKIDNDFTETQLLYKVELTNKNDWQKLEDSLSSVISSWNGTAFNLTEFGRVKIAGKTGTAQIKSLIDEELTAKEEYEGIRLEEINRDHALFVGYGPISKPLLSVVVIVENGESGSAIAAPIAQKLIDFYVEGRI